jgi:hypothetical protein
MPVRDRASIAEYQLLKSRHIFDDKYIITSGINFDQSIRQGVSQRHNLIGQGGPNMMDIENEEISIGGVLSLPIIIPSGDQTGRKNREWVDGLDFLYEILGKNGSFIDTGSRKIFTNSSNEYDAIAIKSVSISMQEFQDVMVNIEFSTNVENAFEFHLLNGDVNNFNLNTMFPEMRAASTNVDVKVGLQSVEDQCCFNVMTDSSVKFNFHIDETAIHGSGIRRPVFTYANYDVAGEFNLLDDIRRYKNFSTAYELYKPSIQTYGKLVKSSSGTDPRFFTISFSDVDPFAVFKFSSDGINADATRNIQNGQLFTKVNLLSYNRNS